MAISLEPEPCAGSGALEVASRVSKLLNNELHADVTFRVGDASFAAHRCLVACTSEPMRAMLGEGFREGAGGEVEIRGVEADVFFEFLRFVYTGEARVTPENAVALLEAANLYDVPPLMRACGRVVVAGLTPENCVELLETGRRYDEPILTHAAGEFILRHADALFARAPPPPPPP